MLYRSFGKSDILGDFLTFLKKSFASVRLFSFIDFEAKKKSKSECAYNTACLSGAAKLARRQRGEKKCGPRERGRKLNHRAERFERGGSGVIAFAYFFLLFLYNTCVY